MAPPIRARVEPLVTKACATPTQKIGARIALHPQYDNTATPHVYTGSCQTLANRGRSTASIDADGDSPIITPRRKPPKNARHS
ncbi:MAG: hypothetical protein HC933_18925 [Pleurocapsa sp. SU_196_0]|nr:hypothetical protein [Pleurocapsa sp. SU_196_0]